MIQERSPAVSPLYLRAGWWRHRRPDAVACRCPDGEATTFAQLSELVAETAAALARAGVREGTRTAVMVPPGPQLWAAVLALARLRAVPVLVDPGLPFGEIRRCLRRARPEAYIGIPRAQAARLLLGWARSARVVVTVGPRWLSWGARMDALRDAASGDPRQWPEPRVDDVALIGYTSGSTGPPKGVPLRHRQLAAQLDALAALDVVSPGSVMLSAFAPFALAATAFGAAALVPDTDPRHPGRADPAALSTAILRHGVTAMFAPPALLDRLARHCLDRGIILEPLRHVLAAGAPLPAGTRERMRAVIRDRARLLSVYGATECLPVAAIESREHAGTDAATAAGKGTCLGEPLPGVRVRVIPVTDGPIRRWSESLPVPAGALGEIAVSAPMVADPYLDDPAATALARIPDGGGDWHRTGDLGRIDAEGRLWFAGRKSERVRTGRGDLCTEQVEPLFADVPGLRRAALVGVGPEGAQRPVLVVEPVPELGRRERPGLIAAVLDAAEERAPAAGIHDVLVRRDLPVDARHQSKIRRHELARWAARKLDGRGR